MILRFVILFVLSVLFRCPAQPTVYPESPEEKRLVKRIADLIGRDELGERLDFSHLTAGERDTLIAEVKSSSSFGSSGGFHPEGIQNILSALGDEETIRSKVEEYMPIGWPIDAAIEKYAPPVAIPMVAEKLFDNGPVGPVPGGDHPAYFPSTAAARLALYVLGNSPSFDASVINWARALYDWETILPPTDSKEEARWRYAQQRDIMREWWRGNQQFFAQKNYKAVQPGNDLKSISEDGATADVPAKDTAEPVPKGATLHRSETVASAKPVVPQVSAITKLGGQSPKVRMLISIGVLLLAGLVVFAAKMTRKR